MAWRLERLVQAGELDNTRLGWTIGWLELAGRSEQLRLKLAGNCHPDLAGWKCRIHRIEPEPEAPDVDDAPLDIARFSSDQSGHAGDITADQMVKHFDIPVAELVKRLHAGEQPPYTWRKCLYLEWFSNHYGRVVIQSTRLAVERIGTRAFELSEEQWCEQHQQNQQEMNYFMTQLGEALSSGDLDNDDQ